MINLSNRLARKPPAAKKEKLQVVENYVVRGECRRCGWCCTVDYVPVDRSKLNVESLFLITARGGRIVRMDGVEGLFIEYPLRCNHLTQAMGCSLWDTPIRPSQCEKSACIDGHIHAADLDSAAIKKG